MDLDSLNRRFSIEKVAWFEVGEGGLHKLVVRSPLADAEVYIHGAHVTHFVPRVGDAKPLLFLSKKAVFQIGKAIRGGVPICFPWFGPKAGDPTAPSHGFLRTMEWTVESLTRGPDEEVSVTFAVAADASTRQFWPFDFTARYTVTISRQLHLSLVIANTGPNTIEFEEALHSYLVVGDVRQIGIGGLGGTIYLDKVNGGARTPQSHEPIRFTGETDRVYIDTMSTCDVDDPTLGRRVFIRKTNSHATVVWNPWIEKSRAFSDFGDDEWPGMVCVETCNCGPNPVSLAPGGTHEMTATISAEAEAI